MTLFKDFKNKFLSNYNSGNWMDDNGPPGRGNMRGGRGRGAFRDSSTDFNMQRNRFVYINTFE